MGLQKKSKSIEISQRRDSCSFTQVQKFEDHSGSDVTTRKSQQTQPRADAGVNGCAMQKQQPLLTPQLAPTRQTIRCGVFGPSQTLHYRDQAMVASIVSRSRSHTT